MNKWEEKFLALVAEFITEEYQAPRVAKVISITEYSELVNDCDCCSSLQSYVDVNYIDTAGVAQVVTTFGDMDDFLETFGV